MIALAQADFASVDMVNRWGFWYPALILGDECGRCVFLVASKGVVLLEMGKGVRR